MHSCNATQINNLQALLEVTKALGQEIHLDRLLELILDKVTEVLDAERSSLFLYDPTKNELWSKIAQGYSSKEIRVGLGVGIAGVVAKTRKLSNIPDAYQNPHFNSKIDSLSNFSTKAVLCLPLIGTDEKLIGVIEILNKKSGGSFGKEDEELLIAFGGQAAIALQRAQLIEAYVESQRVEETLKLAHNIQMSLLPKAFRSDIASNLDIFAKMEPAKDVGGDFYDFFFIEEDYLCLAIGDVSGKGIPAALLMAVTKTLLRAIATKRKSPADIVAEINDNLSSDNDECMFVTFFCGILKLSTGELAFCNAGHNFPYVIHSDQTISYLKNSNYKKDFNNLPLGVEEKIKYNSNTVQIKRGEMILLYTDGINEAQDINGNQYSYKNLEILLKSRQFSSAKALVETISEDVKKFIGISPQSDDIALLATRVLEINEKETLKKAD